MKICASLATCRMIGNSSGASGGLTSWLLGKTTLSFASVWAKLISTMKKAINWNVMSIIGVRSPSARSTFFDFTRIANYCLMLGLLGSCRFGLPIFEPAHQVFTGHADFQQQSRDTIAQDVVSRDRRNRD